MVTLEGGGSINRGNQVGAVRKVGQPLKMLFFSLK